MPLRNLFLDYWISHILAQGVKMGLRWWRDALILSQTKRYLDDR